MKITILFFATLRDYVGAKMINLDIPANTTVAELKDFLVKQYPKMAPAQRTIMTSINREYASDDQVIPSNAEIALFPPVSSG